MLGSGSLEQKLRAGNGRSATATVLSRKDGIQLYSGQASEGNALGKNITRHHYRLRVEPDGEEPFEAKIVIRSDQMGKWSGQLPTRAPVLYDPHDRSRVAFDFDAMNANQRKLHDEWMQEVQASGRDISSLLQRPAAYEHEAPAPGNEIEKLTRLADLRDRGALTDAEFEAEKAKLLG